LRRGKHEYVHEHNFQPSAPGEVKRFAMIDLGDYFFDLKDSWPNPQIGLRPASGSQ